MRIDDRIKKCVAFLQYKKYDNNFIYVGTCFFVSIEDNKYFYAVTAKHVITQVKKLGLSEVFINLNMHNGLTQTINTKISEWNLCSDETVDIAIIKFRFSEEYDHLYFPDTYFMTDKLIESNEIDCGDEVFITGLFKHHIGDKRNSAIVRVGNIALMPSEKIRVGEKLVDAYLIESRSTGGLSGSPVFVNLGETRKIDGEVKIAQGEHIPLLFGLVLGHFDSSENEVDAISERTSNNEKINVGIAIITPVAQLKKFITLENDKNNH